MSSPPQDTAPLPLPSPEPCNASGEPLADARHRLEAIRTYVSAALSLIIVGGVVVAQFMDVETSAAMVGWGGAVVGFWLGARSSGGHTPTGISSGGGGGGKF